MVTVLTCFDFAPFFPVPIHAGPGSCIPAVVSAKLSFWCGYGADAFCSPFLLARLILLRAIKQTGCGKDRAGGCCVGGIVLQPHHELAAVLRIVRTHVCRVELDTCAVR